MIKELRNKRKDLIVKLRSIAGRAEQRDLTPEEQSEIDGLKEQIDKLDQRIAALEAAEVGEDEGEGEGEGEENSERSAGRKGVPFEARDLPDTDGRHPFSLMKVFRHIGGYAKLDGIEAEVHQELCKRSDATKGVRIPWNLATHRGMGGRRESRSRSGRAERRDLTTSAGSGSIAAILGTDLIELLRTRMLTQQFGAVVMSDMHGGTFSLPKQTGKGQTYWFTEGNSPTAANQTLGQVTFTPKTLGCFTDLTRKFMLQTSLDAEAFVKNDLAAIMAREMDRAALNGSGSGAEPLGIVSNTNVPTVAIGINGGFPTWAMVVGLESAVATSNADDGKLGYITNAAGRGILKTTPKIGSTFPFFLWDNNELNGYQAGATNQLPGTFTKGTGTNLSPLVYGNWESLVYGMWGSLDVIEDPYTKSSSGGLRIVFLQDMDIELRYNESFSKCVDMQTS